MLRTAEDLTSVVEDIRRTSGKLSAFDRDRADGPDPQWRELTQRVSAFEGKLAQTPPEQAHRLYNEAIGLMTGIGMYDWEQGLPSQRYS